MKKLKTTLSIILTVILLLVIIFNILSALSIPVFGFRLYQVITGSMEPEIKVNDYIIIKKCNEYNKNDIVTYIDNEGSYVTHRIVDIQDEMITTKGDFNNTNDEPIEKTRIIGKVVFKLRLFKYIIILFKSYFFWIALLIVGMLIIFIIPSKD